jgi:hypothetical protein
MPAVLGQALRKVVLIARLRGLRGAAGWLLTSLCRPQRFEVFVFDLGQPLPPPPAWPGVEVRQLGLAELEALRQRDHSLPVELWYDRIYGLRVCFAAFAEGELAGISWICLPSEPNPFLALRPDEAEVFQTSVLPRFRASSLVYNLSGLTWVCCWRWLAESGFARVYARVPTEQQAWCRGLRYVGFEPVGRLTQRAWSRPRFQLGVEPRPDP